MKQNQRSKIKVFQTARWFFFCAMVSLIFQGFNLFGTDQACALLIYDNQFPVGTQPYPTYTSGILWGNYNSWHMGVPEVPTVPTGYAWGTAQSVSSGQIYGSYYRNEHSYVMSNKIDLAAPAGNYFTLQWAQYLRTYPGDPVRVQVSSNNGMTWTDVYYGGGRVNQMGDPQVWTTKSVNLSSAYATRDFRIRWTIDATHTPYYPGRYGYSYDSKDVGFYFDNVKIWDSTTPLSNLITPGTISGGDSLSWGGDALSDSHDMSIPTSAGDVRMFLPQGLNISNEAGGTFVGDFYSPFVIDTTPPDLGIPGDIINLLAFEIGLEDERLSFNNPVRLLFPDQGGKEFGWSSDGLFHESTPLSGDDGALLDQLGLTDGYLSIGDDLVVWTNHFTVFAMFNTEETPGPGPGPGQVPEPSTMLLIGSGLLGLWGARKKFKK